MRSPGRRRRSSRCRRPSIRPVLTLGTADTTLKTVDDAAEVARDLIRNEGAVAIGELKDAVVEVRALVGAFGAEAKTVLAAYGDTATAATARLDQVEATVSNLDAAIEGATKALASVDSAAASFDTLIEGDGKALVSEARTTLASIQVSADAIERAATDDLPGIIGDVRTRARQRQRDRRPGFRRRHLLHRRSRADCRGSLDDASGGDDDVPDGRCGDRPAGADDHRGRTGARARPRAPSPGRSASSRTMSPRRPPTSASRPSG